MKLFEKFEKNDEAVSPVIGVILMVAITVILAAVIAAFVFGMTGNMQTQKNVAITGGINSTGHAVFTVQGGADLGSVNYINYMVDNNEIGKIFENATVGQENGTGEAVNGKHVKLIGYFNDGSQQILFDRQF